MFQMFDRVTAFTRSRSHEAEPVISSARRIAKIRLFSAVGASVVVMCFVATQSTSGPPASAERTPVGITPSGTSDSSKESIYPFPHIEINEPAVSAYVVPASAILAKPRYTPVIEVPDQPEIGESSPPKPNETLPSSTMAPPSNPATPETRPIAPSPGETTPPPPEQAPSTTNSPPTTAAPGSPPATVLPSPIAS